MTTARHSWSGADGSDATGEELAERLVTERGVRVTSRTVNRILVEEGRTLN